MGRLMGQAMLQLVAFFDRTGQDLHRALDRSTEMTGQWLAQNWVAEVAVRERLTLCLEQS